MGEGETDSVTVYLPTRNRVRSLEAAIHSVLTQSHENIELIVVNDGATDETPILLSKLAACDPRVRVLTNATPKGAPAARNRAIRAARGHFVTGLDDDDTFLPHRLRAFLASWQSFAERGLTPSCLYAQDIHVHAGGREIETRKQSAVRAEDLFATNAVGNQVFAPKAHFVGCGLFNERLPAWQDLECFYRLLQRYGPARLVDLPTYRFDLCPRPDRISKSSEARLREAARIVTALHARPGTGDAARLRRQLFTEDYGLTPGWRDWLTDKPTPQRVLARARAFWTHP